MADESYMGFTYSDTNGGSNTLAVPGGWEIMEDSGITEAVPETGPMATVKFHVKDANDRISFVNQLLGAWSGTPPSNITYRGPYLYPPSPNLICTAVPSIESNGKKLPILGVGLPWMFGKTAIVTAVFTRPVWQSPTNGGYFSIDFSGSGEFLNLPGTTYQFADGTPTNEPIGLLIPQAQITVKRFRMPFLPDQVAVPLLGTLNNAPFRIGWNVYAPSTLLFLGFSSEIAPDPLGNITYNCSYMFNFRPVNWNYAFHPDRTTGFAPVADGNGKGPYQPANFEVLP